jgi:endonuclease III-like uncharacterized protein
MTKLGCHQIISLNEIINDQQWLPKALDKILIGSFVIDRSGWQHLNPKVGQGFLRGDSRKYI